MAILMLVLLSQATRLDWSEKYDDCRAQTRGEVLSKLCCAAGGRKQQEQEEERAGRDRRRRQHEGFRRRRQLRGLCGRLIQIPHGLPERQRLTLTSAHHCPGSQGKMWTAVKAAELEAEPCTDSALQSTALVTSRNSTNLGCLCCSILWGLVLTSSRQMRYCAD